MLWPTSRGDDRAAGCRAGGRLVGIRCVPLRRLRRLRSPLALGVSTAARGRSDQRAHRRLGDRPHRRGRAPANTEGDRIQVSTAPGADGIVRRIEVRAREAGTNWAVFALANNGDEQIDRLIVAPHYRMVGSGLFWPDLGLSRIVNITPSRATGRSGRTAATADIFRITLDPGTVITFVAELRTDRSCRSSICGSRTPTRTRSTRSRSTTASSSASPACSRCS